MKWVRTPKQIWEDLSNEFEINNILNNNILIERIENDQITFRNGNTTVTRNVGN